MALSGDFPESVHLHPSPAVDIQGGLNLVWQRPDNLIALRVSAGPELPSDPLENTQPSLLRHPIEHPLTTRVVAVDEVVPSIRNGSDFRVVLPKLSTSSPVIATLQ